MAMGRKRGEGGKEVMGQGGRGCLGWILRPTWSMWVKTIWLFLMSEWVMIRLFNTEILCLPNEMKYANIPTSFNGGSRANVAIKKGGGVLWYRSCLVSRNSTTCSLCPLGWERGRKSHPTYFQHLRSVITTFVLWIPKMKMTLKSRKPFPNLLFSLFGKSLQIHAYGSSLRPGETGRDKGCDKITLEGESAPLTSSVEDSKTKATSKETEVFFITTNIWEG